MVRKFLFSLILFFATGCPVFPTGCPETKKSNVVHQENQEIWQKITIQNVPIGYSVVRLKGNIVEENMNMSIIALGSKREVKTFLTWERQNDFSTKNFSFELETNGSKNVIVGKIEGNKIRVKIGNTEKYFDVGGKLFIGSSYIFLIQEKIRSGERKPELKIFYFDPSVLKLDTLEIKFEREEGNQIVLSKRFAGIVSEIRFSKNGDFLIEEGPAGIKMVKSDYKDVFSSLGSGQVDIIFSTSSKAYGKLPDIDRRKISYVKLLVEGVESIPSFPPFQIVSKEGDKIYVELTKSYLYEKSVTSDYVSPEPLIESNAPEIINIANQISERGKNNFELAKMVSDWVYSNIEKISVLSIPSAVEVAKTRKGDCNEHAVLSVAILRALGIPSRVAFGLVYDSGAFFYHAWVEFYDGEKWISFDPTWGIFPADILRIKIGNGNVEEWTEVLKYVGKIKITFLDWK